MSKTHSGRRVSFLCDQNLGRLARWLRILGFDTEYMHRWDPGKIEQARASGRVVLTRRRDFAGDPNSLVLESDYLKDQLTSLDKHLNLGEMLNPYSRCSVCNTPLKCATPHDVKDLVPEYVGTTSDTFARCPRCMRIYWKGTHAKRAQDFIRSVFPDWGEA